VLVVIAVAGLALTHLDASHWIPEAAQTEYAGPSYRPEAAPKQLALPAGKVSGVRTD
jgi:hypothetical protein